MNLSSDHADLYLLGAGITFPDHLTVQTIDLLSACVRICTNLTDDKLSRLPSDLYQKCVSLWPIYQDGRIRKDNYRDVTDAVLREADVERPVAWLTQGHPMIFDSVSKALLEEAKSRDWRITVVPAISSLDTMLAELAYDPASGLTVHDATGLVRRKVPVVPSVALILLQVSVFLSDRAHLTLKCTRPDLGPLRDYLLQFFPATHSCALVHSSWSSEEPPRISWIELKALPSVPLE